MAKFTTFKGSWPTLDLVILHTVMNHSSTSIHIPNFIKSKKLCGRTDGRMYERTGIWDPLY